MQGLNRKKLNNINIITNNLNDHELDNKIKLIARLILIQVEAMRFGINLMSHDNYIQLKDHLIALDVSKKHIRLILQEEALNQKLISLA